MNAFNYRMHNKRCDVRAKEFSCAVRGVRASEGRTFFTRVDAGQR